jgi:lipoprotein-releasing system ATP-binding protein
MRQNIPQPINCLLSCNNLTKEYIFNNHESVIETLCVLNNVSLQLNSGETISIVGSSGSGKTSLLQILAGLDFANSGEIRFKEQDIANMSDLEKNRLRNQHFGFIYQFHHLLPEFTVMENIMMPILINNHDITRLDQEKAHYLMHKLKLVKKDNYFPSQLSGGERQRTAIIRALINNPSVVFADEPTGNLDNHTAAQVMELFFELQQELNMAVLLVTHDLQIAHNTSKIYSLHEGNLRTL